jgi:RNA polymerase sigma-70 factor (ECF subfamily)
VSAALDASPFRSPARHTAAVRVGGVRLPTEASDEQLIAAWLAGDASAFDRVYARHRTGVYRYVLRHVRNRSSADELHQDVWLRVVQSCDRFDVGATFTAWLYRIARNRVIDHWRAQRPQVSLDDDGDGDGTPLVEQLAGPQTDDPLTSNIDAEERNRLHAALGTLPLAQRDAFLLHLEGGLSIAQIANVTAAPPETVKSRLRYAYARLRTLMEAPR